MRSWKNNLSVTTPNGCPIIAWFQDKSVFYAHDQHKLHWVHQDKMVILQVKNEGSSLMVLNFVSADHGWFISENVIVQAENAIKVLKRAENALSA